MIATRGSRAPIVYLGLIGLAQLLMSPNDEARYDDGIGELKGVPPRGAGSLMEFFGYKGNSGHAAMTTALRQLSSVDLVRFPRRGAKGYGSWRRFDILDSAGEPYIVPKPRARKPNGYDTPFTIRVPVGFWSNGWLLELSTKEIEALLGLLYQRERQPKRPDGSGWFISTEQRHLLCLDTKTYGKSHRTLVDRGLLRAVDPARYQASRARRGLGPKNDRPHEFIFDLDLLKSAPAVAPVPDDDPF